MKNLIAVAMVATLASSFSVSADSVSAVLKLKERIPVEKLAQEVRDPNSARMGRPYEPEDIKNLSGPLDADYDSLLKELRSKGFTITKESKTHLWVSIQGASTAFDREFGSNIKQVGGKKYKNLSLPQVNGSLSLIERVSGLDNTRRSKPRLRRPAVDAAFSGIPQSTIKSAYGFNPIYQGGVSGAGQDIAIATYDGFNIDDVKFFYSNSKLSPGPQVDQVIFNGTPTYSEDSAMETQLDAEFTGMIAPGANIHVFASATNDDASELALFTAILDDNRAKIVNYSWGDCETNVSAGHQADMDKVFTQAAAQGVNIMVASGDSGSDSCQNNTTVADWPGANPNVVAVGGTSFNGNASSPKEAAWSGSGGGISGLFDLPSWQSVLPSNYPKRSYPDVAFNADPKTGQAIYAHNNGAAAWVVIGGTSMAAPQWSGFLALVGQARQMAGKPTLGYLNPFIYGLNSSQMKSAFNDVTSGSNGAYSAGQGWDAVTGWGSMQASSLLQILLAN